MRAGVEPGVAAAQLLDSELLPLEVDIDAVGDLELATGGGLDGLRDVHNLVVVEVEPGYRVL